MGSNSVDIYLIYINTFNKAYNLQSNCKITRPNRRGHQLSKRSKNSLSLQVLKKFRIIYGPVRQHFREIEQTCGITGSQLWILQEVAKSPDIGISDLAERLSIHQSTCSQLVEKLVTRGLLVKERSKEDQRRVGLCLTEAATRILKTAPPPSEGALPEALQALPESALLSLERSLMEV